MRVLVLVVAAGCFHVDAPDCKFECASGSECPSDLACIAGFCQAGPENACGSVVTGCGAHSAPPSTCRTPFGATSTGAPCAALCGMADANDELAWADAKLSCESVGWKLAMLDTDEKRRSITIPDDDFWVGAHFDGSIWTWDDGSVVAYDAWLGGTPPRPATGSECAMFMTQTLTLEAKACANADDYICMYPK